MSGNTIYAGGEFTQIGGQGRSRIAALNATSGLPTAWNPNASWDPNALSAVWALAVSGNVVYAGGRFTQIGGQGAQLYCRLGRHERAGHCLEPWRQWMGLCAGSTWQYGLRGGSFSLLADQERSHLAAVDAT